VMQGDTALKHIMIRSPVPVLMISTLQTQSLNKVFEFLQVGAVDFLPKTGSSRRCRRVWRALRDLVCARHVPTCRISSAGANRRGYSPPPPAFVLAPDKILVVLGAGGCLPGLVPPAIG